MTGKSLSHASYFPASQPWLWFTLALALAAVVVISGLRVVQTMVLKGGSAADLVDIKFVLLDLTGIALFVVFLALAVRSARSHDRGLHLRLMACTALIPLEAANERTAILLMPGIVPDFGVALYASLLSMDVAFGTRTSAGNRELGRHDPNSPTDS